MYSLKIIVLKSSYGFDLWLIEPIETSVYGTDYIRVVWIKSIFLTKIKKENMHHPNQYVN